MLEIFNGLMKYSSAPGREEDILSYIEKEYADFSPEYDGMGNLVLSKKCKKENARKVMLAVACDDPGFIVNYIEENGYLRITSLGNTNTVSSAFGEVVIDGELPGLVVGEKNAEIKNGDASKLYVDIGAQSREEAEAFVCLGDICSAVPKCVPLAGSRLGGCGVSLRMCMAIAIKAFLEAENEDTDLYLSFNVQDKLRHRGAKTAAFDVLPDVCIALEMCESFDTIGASKRGEAVLGDGVVILAKTSDYLAIPALRCDAEKTARSEGVVYKTCVYGDKTTGAGVMSKCGKGVPCIALAIPVRNTGSGAEVLCISDAENTKKLISAMICK